MMFSSEQELVNLLRTQLPGPFCASSNALIFDEVNLGYGIADLVITQYTPIDSKFRHTFFTHLHITILDLLHKVGSITLSLIRKKTRASSTTIDQCVKSLVDERFASINSDTIKLERRYSSNIEKTIAIEAKLKNWKRALNQAYRYKLFSNESYVCMPEEYSRAASSHIEMFKKMEVGLLAINDGGEISFLYVPPHDQPIDHKMNMLLNEQLLTKLQAS